MTLASILLSTINTNAADRIREWAAQVPLNKPTQPSDLQEMTSLEWFLAANSGNISIIQQYLEAGFFVDTISPKGRSALHCATLHGHPTCVQELLTWKADFNLEDFYSNIPMLDLAAEGVCNQMIFSQILDLFITAGFDINAPNQRGYTALHLAVINKKIDYVAALLKAKANVNAQDEKGNTPLRLLLGIKGEAAEQMRVIIIHYGGTL